MRIPGAEVGGAPPIIGAKVGGLSPEADGTGGPSFGDVLSGFLGKVNASQQNADQMVESLALGEPVDVHQVMISLGEASNALQMTMQVRNKVLEAYQELMRTPV